MYEDDFADPMARYKEITQQTTKSNPETMGRYHTNWLNMMYPRLRLAANLLTDDGVIFISIDDNEVFNLKKICDEVFGEENFAAQIPWRKRTAKSDVPFGISQDYEWIICYAKTEKFVASVEGKERKYFETDDFPGRPWRFHDLTTQRTVEERPNSDYTMINPKTGDEYPVNPLRCWAVTKETFKEYYEADKIIFPGDYDFLNISKPVFRYWKEDDMAKAGDSFGRIAVSTKLNEDIGMSQDGTKEITKLFDNKVFSYPKPTALIKFLVSTNTSEEDIILDFFSGSATTAHAVMQLNVEDGGNRKFICVQLPEACDEKSGAYKAGYKNICEIGKERIRRAGKKILDEQGDQIGIGDEEKKPLDVGFKVFKLDDSNLKIWDSTPITGDDQIEMFYERMNSMIDSIKDDRTDMDVVYEIMLKMGVPLDTEVQYIEIDGKIVYIVGDFLLMIALYNNITAEDIDQMAAYAPAKIVCAEQGFADDTALSNAHYILRDKQIELKLV